MIDRIQVAMARAHEVALAPPRAPVVCGRTFARTLAMGDPQAPLGHVLAILDGHGLLGDEGALRDDVALVSMGDHFDYGRPHDRDVAARDGLALLAWLAMHPSDQVTLLAGNHDLARVGELWGFDDDEFARAQAVADRAYPHHAHDASSDRARSEFARQWPQFSDPEVVARDFSTYRAVQREWVTALLLSGRMVLAAAPRDDLLLTHAGITVDELTALGLGPYARASAVARALNDTLAHAVQATIAQGLPFVMPGLHVPGSQAQGDGRGLLYHRPSNPARDDWEGAFDGPPRRRFDPRRLPLTFAQAIGHNRDAKCRRLLAGFCDDTDKLDGVLRHLVTDGADVHYVRGLPKRIVGGTLLFLDTGMSSASADAVQLLDVDATSIAARMRRLLSS